MTRGEPITRRRFLSGATVATFAVPRAIRASALGADGAVPPSERITMGAIGFGARGRAVFGDLTRRPGVQALAVCNVQEARLQPAAERGLAVYQEFLFACEMVRSGRIGELKSATVCVGGPPQECSLPAQPVPPGVDWDMWLGPAPWRPFNADICTRDCGGWEGLRDYSGGGMTGWGSHHFDIAYRVKRPLRWDPAKEQFIGDPDADRRLDSDTRIYDYRTRPYHAQLVLLSELRHLASWETTMLHSRRFGQLLSLPNPPVCSDVERTRIVELGRFPGRDPTVASRPGRGQGGVRGSANVDVRVPGAACLPL